MSAPRPSQGLPITRRPWTQPQPETNSPLKEVCANNGMSDPSHRDREPAGMLINLHLICMTTSPFQDRRTPRPSWPPGGARSKGLAGHSASKQSLQSWLILGGAFDPHPFFTPYVFTPIFQRERTKAPGGWTTQQDLACVPMCSWKHDGSLPFLLGWKVWHSSSVGLTPGRAPEVGV